uniref:Thioredoxin n=1 Tax=Desulfomonile tiedjei TaxID=2358 RepID=A0A7C4EX19_9BACT
MKRSVFQKVSIALFTFCCVLTGAAAGIAAEPKINLDALLAKRVPILLEFGRGWCIPCKYMKPILDDMAKLYAGKAIVLPVDMDVNRDLVRQFNIRLMPTQVFLMPDGKEFFRNEGTLEREHIVQVFTKMGLPAPPPMAGGAPGAVSQTPPR